MVDSQMRSRAALRYIALAAIFAVGIAIARLCWSHINLPFANPWNIVGAPALLKFNPSTNRVRYLCMLLAPCVLLLGFYLASRGKARDFLFGDGKQIPHRAPPAAKPPDRKIAFALCAALALLFMVISLACPTDYAGQNFDPFHEGESLGPTVSYLRGQIPYRDFFVLHGFIQDCGRVALGYKLFGHSIAAVRTFSSMLKVITFGLIAVFLWMVFEGQAVWAISAGAAFLFLCVYNVPTEEGLMEPPARIFIRDITTPMFLIAMIGLHRALKPGPDWAPRGLAVLSFVPAFVAVASLGFSVDRGMFLTMAYCALCVIVYLAYLLGASLRQQAAYLGGALCGVAGGVLAIAALVEWNLGGFAHFAFRVLPRLFAMMDTLEFPIGRVQWFVVIALVSFNAYWIVLKYLQLQRAGGSLRAFCGEYFAETALLAVSVTMFIGALGISDWDHVSAQAVTAYILFLVILFRHAARGLIATGTARAAYAFVVAAAAVVLLGWGIRTAASDEVIKLNFPLGTPDSMWIRPDYQETCDFLRQNLRPGENFFTLTSEGAWYYWLDQPCPTRFVVAYAAGADFLQRQTVRDLKRRNVKYVIFQNDYFSNRILGIPTPQRLPIVTRYLCEHYKPYIWIGSNEIWVRKK